MDIDDILRPVGAPAPEPEPDPNERDARIAARRVFEAIGGKLTQLASLLGERPVTVYAWKRRGLIPAHAALKIEALQHPRLPFTAAQIRPDVVDWDYVRSKPARTRV